MRKILVVLWLGLAGALPYPAFCAPTETPLNVSRIFLPSVAEPAKAAHLEPLKNTVLPADNKEVRIWIGFGAEREMRLVRISVDSAGQVHGEAVFSHGLESKNPGNDEKSYFAELAKQCKTIGSDGEWESCSPASSESADWAKAYRSIVALGLWDLPDDSKLPKPNMSIVDGAAMLVELRSGTDYRAYSYGNPSFNEAPEAQKAAKIMDIAGGVGRVEIH
jgi:hypothetical protein